jgi:hypothetical protein
VRTRIYAITENKSGLTIAAVVPSNKVVRSALTNTGSFNTNFQ